MRTSATCCTGWALRTACPSCRRPRSAWRQWSENATRRGVVATPAAHAGAGNGARIGSLRRHGRAAAPREFGRSAGGNSGGGGTGVQPVWHPDDDRHGNPDAHHQWPGGASAGAQHRGQRTGTGHPSQRGDRTGAAVRAANDRWRPAGTRRSKPRWDSRASSPSAVRKTPWRSPWEALHVWRGFAAEQSTVTAVGAAGTVEIVDADSADAEGVLTTMAHSMTIAGNLGRDVTCWAAARPLLLIAPEHAEIIARTHSRRQAQAFLFEHARLPVERAGAGPGGSPAGKLGDGIDGCSATAGHHAGGAGRIGRQIDLTCRRGAEARRQ